MSRPIHRHSFMAIFCTYFVHCPCFSQACVPRPFISYSLFTCELFLGLSCTISYILWIYSVYSLYIYVYPSLRAWSLFFRGWLACHCITPSDDTWIAVSLTSMFLSSVLSSLFACRCAAARHLTDWLTGACRPLRPPASSRRCQALIG